MILVMWDLSLVGIVIDTENFEQASEDYESSLRVLAPYLSTYSRRLSDAHLRLGLALEFHPDDARRSKALDHVEQATNVLHRRLSELEKENDFPQGGPLFSEKDNLSAFDEDQRKREIRDIQEVLKDVQLKVRHFYNANTARRNED